MMYTKHTESLPFTPFSSHQHDIREIVGNTEDQVQSIVEENSSLLSDECRQAILDYERK